MVTNSIAVIILNHLLLPITEEVHKCSGKQTISAHVINYSKSDQEVNAFVKLLTSSDCL